MIRSRVNIPFNYSTIRLTKSRIDKGLLAIPVSLINLFSKDYSTVTLINENGKEETKTFTPYTSSSRESRIGGMREFYENYKLKSGDEIIIQKINEMKFKIIPERIFHSAVKNSENMFDASENYKQFSKIIEEVSKTTNQDKETVIRNEFVRLSTKSIDHRNIVNKKSLSIYESVPYSIRKTLLFLYRGRCQVSGFTFLKKNQEPYFEIHHIDPLKGHHVKNLLVVSPNVHAQFTYSNVKQEFDNSGWLRKVKFNGRYYNISQIVDQLPTFFEKEVHTI